MSPRPPVPRDRSANTSSADGPRLTAAGTRMDKAPSPALRPLWSAARARPPSGLPVSSQAVWPWSLPGSPQDSRPLTRVLLRPSVSLWVGCWGLREALPSQASSLPWPRQGCPGPDESWSDSSPAAQRPLLWPQTSQGGGGTGAATRGRVLEKHRSRPRPGKPALGAGGSSCFRSPRLIFLRRRSEGP